MNGPALGLQTRLVAAAKEAGTIKQFIPSEFSAFGAIGAHTPLFGHASFAWMRAA